MLLCDACGRTNQNPSQHTLLEVERGTAAKTPLVSLEFMYIVGHSRSSRAVCEIVPSSSAGTGMVVDSASA